MTFPFPWRPGTEPRESESLSVRAIAEAARELIRLRDAWLDPPDACENDLRARTLTKLYNQRPAWLENAHARLDRAVLEAYGLAHSATKEEILSHLLQLNLDRAAASAVPLPASSPKKAPGAVRVLDKERRSRSA